MPENRREPGRALPCPAQRARVGFVGRSTCPGAALPTPSIPFADPDRDGYRPIRLRKGWLVSKGVEPENGKASLSAVNMTSPMRKAMMNPIVNWT